MFVNEVVLLCERSEPLVAFKKRWSSGVFVSEESSVGLALQGGGRSAFESGGKFRKSYRPDGGMGVRRPRARHSFK